MLKIMKASAGSGKTYSLARTYITLLLKNADRHAYRHVLAVTFTNKATEEMKGRILKELHVLATRPAASGYHDDFVPSLFPCDEALMQKAGTVLRDILHDYGAFAVSTIDRFFQQTLKAFSREIGQFASYQVELDKDSVVAESVDRVLDSLTEDDDNILKWLTDNVLEQIGRGGRYNTDANLLDMAKRLKSPQRQEVLQQFGVDEEQVCSHENLVKVRTGCREVTTAFRNLVRTRAQAALTVLHDAGVDPAESNNRFLKALYTYADLDDTAAIAPPSPSFMAKASDHEKWFSKAKARNLLPKVYPFLEAPLEDFCALWDKEFKVFNTAEILDGQLYGLGVAGELGKAFREIMREKNILCIDDSNTILKGIIDGSDAPFIYEKTGVRYDHFLLDEFQDTANVQWANFSPLLHNSNAQGGENLIVGDVKQSIYRWRGSDWKLLDRNVPEEFPGHEEEILDTNYRSLPEVVRFNNGYFTAAASILDEINGSGEGGPLSRIYADVRQKVAKGEDGQGSVSVTFCQKGGQLQKVLEAVNEARAAGARLSEIAVLVRSNASGEEVAGYLMANGVTVITDDSLKVRSSVTVRRIVSLMSYLENPADTVNGYLADMLDMDFPDRCTSLIDMAEAIIRKLKENDKSGEWRGEVLHVQSFMDHLQDYVASEGNNLRAFLKYWEGEDPSISSPSSGESVRVMTIHKSKGLDFPYVIIPFAEKIRLYRKSSSWCVPDLSDTPLEGIAEGVYDVLLCQSSDDTLFSPQYREERLMQQVDNINTIYVAMTRAALGIHVIADLPSAKCVSSVEAGDLTGFTDFSQILYWYVAHSGIPSGVHRISEEDFLRFDVGRMVDFDMFRKKSESGVRRFEVSVGEEYPSYPLNPDTRLRLSSDSMDFFSEDGRSGTLASNRIRGVVLHDVLSDVRVPSDLGDAVARAEASGNVTAAEAREIYAFLSERLEKASARGWFPEDASMILNEVDMIDSDGQVYRPDRVVVEGRKVIILDYKFGEKRRSHEHQVAGYADMWRRMGYDEVTAVIWYIHTDECVVL